MMVQPVEGDPAAQPAGLPNGDVAPAAAGAPDAAPAPAPGTAPAAAPAPAPAPVPAAPAPAPAPAAPAPAPAPAAGAGAVALPARPAALPGPRRRPVLPAAQLLGTESRTCQLLSGLPAVDHLCRRGQRQHVRLVQTNWIYTVVFVYTAFVYKALVVSQRFGGSIIGMGIDTSMFNLLTYVIDRYPFLRARPNDMRTATKNYLHDNRRRGVVSTLSVTMVSVTLRPVSFAFHLWSLMLRAWTWIIERIAALLNDDRPLWEADISEVATLAVGRTVAIFWRIPFNIFYHWLAIPFLIHPGQFFKCLHDELQDILVPDVPGGDGVDIYELPGNGDGAPAGPLALEPAPAPAAADGDEAPAEGQAPVQAAAPAEANNPPQPAGDQSGAGNQSEPELSPEVAQFRLDSFRSLDSPSVRELIFKFSETRSLSTTG